MAGLIVRLALALVLVASSLFKLASPGSSRSALATFGIRGEALGWAVWGGVIVAELGLAVGVAAGLDEAAYAAAALMSAFGIALLVALRTGRAGAPCACFGSRSRVGWPAVIRSLVLSFAFAAVPAIPEGTPTTDEWLTLGLIAALLVCAGLSVAVLALAREVGMLRLRLGPGSALEIPEEGPAIGGRIDLIERFEPGPRAELALAVFTSQTCHVCRALEPAVASLSRDPVLAVEIFEEQGDAETWTELDVPGSPFAVALGLDGTVLAKGTFNDLAQLESVLATAERRRAEHGVAKAAGIA
jgi:hypothetical protein